MVHEVGPDQGAHRAEGGEGGGVLVAERAGRDQRHAVLMADDGGAAAERQTAGLEREFEGPEVAIELLQAHGKMVRLLDQLVKGIYQWRYQKTAAGGERG